MTAKGEGGIGWRLQQILNVLRQHPGLESDLRRWIATLVKRHRLRDVEADDVYHLLLWKLAMTRGWERIVELAQSEPQLRAYLWRCAMNMVISLRKKNSWWWQQWERMFRSNGEPEAKPAVDDASEEWQQLLSWVTDPVDRQILYWRYRDSKPYAEIARTLEITEEAARKRAERARLQLRRRLGDQGWGQ